MKALTVAGGVGWRSACYEYVTSDLSYEWELEKWGKDGMKKKRYVGARSLWRERTILLALQEILLGLWGIQEVDE